MMLYPFSRNPGQGHPALAVDSYDLQTNKHSLKTFRWLLYLFVFIFFFIFSYINFGYLNVQHSNFFQQNYYLSDKRYFLFWILDKFAVAQQYCWDNLHKEADELWEPFDPESDDTLFLPVKYPLFSAYVNQNNGRSDLVDTIIPPLFREECKFEGLRSVIHQQVFNNFVELEVLPLNNVPNNSDLVKFPTSGVGDLPRPNIVGLVESSE